MILNNYNMIPDLSTLKDKKINKIKNNICFNNLYNRFVNLALTKFKWVNLPETCNETFLEWCLLMYGKAAFIKDEELGFITLPFSSSEKINIYGESSTIKAYGMNGYIKDYTAYIDGSINNNVQSVRCYDNPVAFPMINVIYESALKISDSLRTIDVGVKKLKNPFVFIGTKDMEQDIRRMFNAISENEEAIFLTDFNELRDVLKIENIQYDSSIIKSMWENYQSLYNVLKESLGISNNTQVDKRERLLVDEVNQNEDITEINLNSRLSKRKEFCRKVNECFSLNIDVEVNEIEPKEINYEENIEDVGTGGKDNE